MAALRSIQYKVLSIKVFSVIFSFLLFSIILSTYYAQPVFAHHCDFYDLTTPEGQARCAALSGGQYCDNNQIWLDLPDGTHQFLSQCSTDTTCRQPNALTALAKSEVSAICEPNSSTTSASHSASLTPVDTSKLSTAQKVSLLSLDETTDGIPCPLIGVSLAPNHRCLDYDTNGQLKTLTADGGAIGGLGKIMATLYSQPPISTKEYLASVRENLGLVKPALAAPSDCGPIPGSGCLVIQPVLKLWQLARNISYLAFILVFVAVGFMIMFRTRINQQTVVSAQQALPGLVIGLILVTFSYLISSFIVDLSFVGMKLVAYSFSESVSGVHNLYNDPVKLADNVNIFGLFGTFTWNGQLLEFVPKVAELFHSILGELTSPGQALVDKFSNLVTPFTFPGTGFIAKLIFQGASLALGGVVGMLVILILLIALFIQMFRLLWQLVSSYIAVFIITISAPFIILIASIPGRGSLIGLWWKSLLGNVLVFPAVFLSFMFAGVFLANVTSTSTLGFGGQGDFTTTLPLFSGIPVDVLKLIIGYGIILGTPAVPGMVKKALGVPDIQGIPQAALGGALAGFGAGSGFATKGYQTTSAPVRRAHEAYQRDIANADAIAAAAPPVAGMSRWARWRRGLIKNIPF